jgi:hypothetical protein
MAFIVAIRLAKDHQLVAWLISAFSVIAIISLATLIAARETTNEQPYTLTSVKDESAQVPSYLLTYVFPFIFVDLGSNYDLLAYALFVALLALMLLRTDLILVNPVLLVAGYHLFQIESSTGYKGLLLSRERPQAGQEIKAVSWAAGALKLTQIRP